MSPSSGRERVSLSLLRSGAGVGTRGESSDRFANRAVGALPVRVHRGNEIFQRDQRQAQQAALAAHQRRHVLSLPIRLPKMRLWWLN